MQVFRKLFVINIFYIFIRILSSPLNVWGVKLLHYFNVILTFCCVLVLFAGLYRMYYERLRLGGRSDVSGIVGSDCCRIWAPTGTVNVILSRKAKNPADWISRIASLCSQWHELAVASRVPATSFWRKSESINADYSGTFLYRQESTAKKLSTFCFVR